MFVKPKDGVQVLDPHTMRPLPAEGAEAPETAYFLRRLRDGDLTIVERAESKQDAEPSTSQA